MVLLQYVKVHVTKREVNGANIEVLLPIAFKAQLNHH
jgi:hypothetical protein